MHGPSFWVHINLRPEKPMGLRDFPAHIYPEILDTMATSLIRPLSMEFCLPGEAVAHKFPGSIDGSSYWADNLDMRLFPGEVFLADAGVTTMLNPPRAMDDGKADGLVVKQINEFYSHVLKRFEFERRVSDPRISFSSWGLTKCFVYNRADDEVCHGWFLKGRLARATRFTPILRLFLSHRVQESVKQYSLSFLSCSHIYSYYEFNGDDPAILTPPENRARIEAAHFSAEVFARTVRDLVHRLVGGTSIQWEVECERQPDFAGAIPESLSSTLAV